MRPSFGNPAADLLLQIRTKREVTHVDAKSAARRIARRAGHVCPLAAGLCRDVYPGVAQFEGRTDSGLDNIARHMSARLRLVRYLLCGLGTVGRIVERIVGHA